MSSTVARMLYPEAVLAHANGFVRSSLGYSWTSSERQVLERFFTNLSGRVFFVHGFPPNVSATLTAMYSRMQNARGIRGVFVDAFLPGFLVCFLRDYDEKKTPEATLRERGITSLETFLASSNDAKVAFYEFLKRAGSDAEYMERLADSRKTRSFLSGNMDKYGHNSIGRNAAITLCFEGVSILAAKSIEWNRPGSGFIELSTRYVRMSGAGCYPIWSELAAGYEGTAALRIEEMHETAFHRYRHMLGEKLDGPFPDFLRTHFRHHFVGDEKGMEMGINGEACDVLGNLLPSSTLTCVACMVSGEAFEMLLRHLVLDNLPETRALVQLIVEEAPKVGAHQFERHYTPTEWDVQQWQYLRPRFFDRTSGDIDTLTLYDPLFAEGALQRLFEVREECLSQHLLQEALGDLSTRGTFDKLPSEFEAITVMFQGVMSFRGWRDLHRMGLSTHGRTLVTPEIGYYEYDKPHPSALSDLFIQVHKEECEMYKKCIELGIPPALSQYPLSLGNLVGFTYGANLRQHEFANWQRTKPDVNHEVRRVFCAIEQKLCSIFPWWKDISRASAFPAHTVPAYVFARGKPVPLPALPRYVL